MSCYRTPNSRLPNWPPDVRVCGLHSTPYGPPILPADIDLAELRREQLARLKRVPPHYTVVGSGLDAIACALNRQPC